MIEFIPNVPSTFLWAVSDWFILLSQFCSKTRSNQWIGSRVRSVPCFTSHLKRFSLRAVTKNIKSAVPGGTPLPRLILIYSQYLRLQKYRLHLFTFYRTDGRISVIVHLFRYVQMFGSAYVRSFYSSPCQSLYIYTVYVWWKQIYIWLNHSNILIYYHVGVLLFNIFWNLWHFVQDYLINKKLKRTALIINQHIGMISEWLCDTEDWCKGSWIYIYIYIYIYTLNKIINATLLFCPHFSWAVLKDLRLFLYTKYLFLSNIVHK